MTAFSRIRHAGLAAIATLVLAAPAAAQTVGASYILSDNDQVELPDATGFAAHVHVEVGETFGIRFSYFSLSDESSKQGEVCDRYVPNLRCDQELTLNTATLSGLRAIAILWVQPADAVALGVGAGPSFNQIDGESTGESGREANLFVPTGGHIGLSTGLFAKLSPIRGLPLSLTAGLTANWVRFSGGCSTQIPPAHDPYCETTSTRELELGLAYAF